MTRVVYMPRMRRELRRIVELIADDSPPAANTFVDEIEHLCSLLAVTPEMGPRRPKIGPNVRSLNFGNYLIFYRWSSSQDRVDVLCIWHGSRRPPRLG